MSPFWIVTVIVWGGVMIYATPGAYAAAIHQSSRRGDPMRLACWLISLVMVTGALRWIVRPDSETLWKAVYVVTVLTGFYILRLMRAYGRGDDLDDA